MVDRGLEIRAQIERLEVELEKIEEKLRKAGLEGEQQDLKDADREGRRFLARGSAFVVPVVFTADKLMQTFKKSSAAHTQIQTIAGDLFSRFYTLTQTYETLCKDGKQFRAQANELLGPKAPAFITACLAKDKHGIPKSDVKVEWGDAAAVDGNTTMAKVYQDKANKLQREIEGQ